MMTIDLTTVLGVAACAVGGFLYGRAAVFVGRWLNEKLASAARKLQSRA